MYIITMTDSETKSILNMAKIRATRKKVAILKEIAGAYRPIDAYELHKNVAERIPMDLATVYRSLTAFRQHGIVSVVSDDSGVLFYEMTSDKDRMHAHFKCERCSRYFCLPALSSNEKKILSRSASRFMVNDICISLHGLCEECRKETQ